MKILFYGLQEVHFHYTYGLVRDIFLSLFLFSNWRFLVFNFYSSEMSAEPPSPSGDVPRLPMNGIGLLDANYGNFLFTIPSTIPITIRL